MNLEQLRVLQTENVQFEDRIDINSVKIDYALSQMERAISYINQIKNPYAFRCGDCAVNLRFTKSGKPLEECVASYLWSQKDNQ
jgi:hypothetical protein